MSPSRSQRKKRLTHTLQVPLWYYIGLAVVAVAGIVLIVISTQSQTGGVTDDGDYFMGDANAPVTIYEWGSFG